MTVNTLNHYDESNGDFCTKMYQFYFRCGAVEIPKKYSNEIDTPFDLRVAEAQLIFEAQLDAHSFL
jgi:hypothetical protein